MLAALLTEPQPASDSAAQVFSVTEMVTIEVLPERPLSEPVSRPDRQKTTSKIAGQPSHSIIQAGAPEDPLVASQKARPAVAQSFAQSPAQSQPITQLSVEKPSRSAAAPVPVATASRQAGKQQSVSKEGERKLVRKHLEAFKFYPGSARRRGIEGHVDVAFTLAQNGAATEVAVLQGSGYAILDQAAMETVYRAQPFPIQKGAFRFRLRFKRL